MWVQFEADMPVWATGDESDADDTTDAGGDDDDLNDDGDDLEDDLGDDDEVWSRPVPERSPFAWAVVAVAAVCLAVAAVWPWTQGSIDGPDAVTVAVGDVTSAVAWPDGTVALTVAPLAAGVGCPRWGGCAPNQVHLERAGDMLIADVWRSTPAWWLGDPGACVPPAAGALGVVVVRDPAGSPPARVISNTGVAVEVLAGTGSPPTLSTRVDMPEPCDTP